MALNFTDGLSPQKTRKLQFFSATEMQGIYLYTPPSILNGYIVDLRIITDVNNMAQSSAKFHGDAETSEGVTEKSI